MIYSIRSINDTNDIGKCIYLHEKPEWYYLEYSFRDGEDSPIARTPILDIIFEVLKDYAGD